MTKEELWEKWGPQKYMLVELAELFKSEFFEDLDKYYASTHQAELEKTFIERLLKKEKDIIYGCTQIGPGEDCCASEKCPYCTDPPDRFLKGYDCYD